MDTQRQVRVGCEFEYDSAVDTPAVAQVAVDPRAGVTLVREEWAGEPSRSRRTYGDLYGNRCERMSLPAGASTLRYDAVVLVPDATEPVDLDVPETPVDDLPGDALIFTLPSRYTVPDILGDEAWDLFGAVPPGYRRVQAICDHVNGSIRFAYGSSTPQTTAADVRAAGVGVCRDFAHLAISYCRALNIPARYVFGYIPDMDVKPLPEPMDFAAWMEVYLGDSWWTFDPRNNVTRKGRVLIGRGRDALDVAMVTTYGGPLLKRMEVWAEEIESPGPSPQGAR